MNETLSNKEISWHEEGYFTKENISLTNGDKIFREEDIAEFIQKVIEEDIYNYPPEYLLECESEANAKDVLNDIAQKILNRVGSKFTDNSPLSKEKSEDKTKNWNGMMSHSSSEDTFKEKQQETKE
jgi:hypothetical protein